MNAVGIIMPHMMRQLADIHDNDDRNIVSVASLEIASMFRCVDIVLGNMLNSGIENILCIPNSRDDMAYVGNLEWCHPVISNDVDNYLNACNEEYVIVSYAGSICRIDYEEVLSKHILKNADVTYLTNDSNEYMGCFVISKENCLKLFKNINNNVQNRSINLLSDTFEIFNKMMYNIIGSKNELCYMIGEYGRMISDMTSYYKVNMEFLNSEVRHVFFRKKPEIHTVFKDNPPAKYNELAKVCNSIISNGCVINGAVDNSVIFDEVYIGHNSKIKNSVILDDVYIGDNAYIENCIVGSHSTIRANTTYIGRTDNIGMILGTT